jgi:L-Ala-D/L-Glu epimerase / N-acetyl-D-glutamate racemase
MRICTLTAHVVRLPLKRPFAHASVTRHDSENVLVRCTLEDGTTGWGEGVPRSYVTSETPNGCLDQLAATPVAEQLEGDCTSWPDVVRLCKGFRPTIDREDPRGCYGNALRCAVELSILDAFGRLFGEPVSRVADHFEPARSVLNKLSDVQYSAAIDAGSRKLWRKSLVRRLYGFRQCKVKVGAAGDDDIARVRTIRRWIGQRMDLRLDANEAWQLAELSVKVEPLLQFDVSCIEQPVPHKQVGELAQLRAGLRVPVMLDESLTSETDARNAIRDRTCDLFNIRLSKCGGFLNSLRLAGMAVAAGLGFQLGCHPGESGVLSAAGRHWACRVKGTRYLEGSYDRHLFAKLLTNEDVTFGYGGWAPTLNSPGLGVTVNETALGEMTLRRQEFLVT